MAARLISRRDYKLMQNQQHSFWWFMVKGEIYFPATETIINRVDPIKFSLVLLHLIEKVGHKNNIVMLFG